VVVLEVCRLEEWFGDGEKKEVSCSVVKDRSLQLVGEGYNYLG